MDIYAYPDTDFRPDVEAIRPNPVVVTVATNPEPGLARLKESLELYGYPYRVYDNGGDWRGFGTKLWLTKKACEELTDYSHIIFLDGYDTLAIKPYYQITDSLSLLRENIVLSTERNCWPDRDRLLEYERKIYGWSKARENFDWTFVCSGVYIARREWLLEMFTRKGVKDKIPEVDDQRFMTDLFLSELALENLDFRNLLCQSVAFSNPGDFRVEISMPDWKPVLKNMRNMVMRTSFFVHGNGRTPLDDYYDIFVTRYKKGRIG